MIEARAITVLRSGRRVLERVDARVRPARVLALVGPNGAGKSTLLRALTGELAPSKGSVLVDGEPLSCLAPTELARRRAFLPQESPAAFDMRALDYVALARLPHGEPGASRAALNAAYAALDECRAADLAERDLSRLSGGERQRVRIARALAQVQATDGSIAGRHLLLDEPTASLDPAHALALCRLVRELAHRGVAIALSIHDLALALCCADDALVLRAGRVLASGQAAEALDAETLSEAFHARCSIALAPDGERKIPVFDDALET